MKVDIVNYKVEVVLSPEECLAMGYDFSEIFNIFSDSFYEEFNVDELNDTIDEMAESRADELNDICDVVFTKIISGILKKDLNKAQREVYADFFIDYNNVPYMEMVFSDIELEDYSNPFDIVSSGTCYVTIQRDFLGRPDFNDMSMQRGNLIKKDSPIVPINIATAINTMGKYIKNALNQQGISDEEIEKIINDPEDYIKNGLKDTRYIFEARFKTSGNLLDAVAVLGSRFPKKLKNTLFTDISGNLCLRIMATHDQADLGGRLINSLNEYSDVIYPQHNQNKIISEVNAIIKDNAMQEMYKQFCSISTS